MRGGAGGFPGRGLGLLVAGALWAGGAGGRAAPEAESPPPPARIGVRGLGALANRAAVLMLRKLWPEKKLPPELPAHFLEDGALLLRRQLAEKGFLKARVRLSVTGADGASRDYLCDGKRDFYLPAGQTARRAVFTVTRGVRYHFKELKFVGLVGLSATQAEGFFYPTESLLPLAGERPYHPELFARSRRNLERELAAHGHRDARVEVARLRVDDVTGRVRATLRVIPGPVFVVRTLVVEVRTEAGGAVIRRETRRLDRPWMPLWRRDMAEQLKQEWFARGYADAAARIEPLREEPRGGRVWLDFRAEVIRGPRVRLGGVEFTGQRHTREWLLRRVARVKGPYLDRLAADRGRDQLSKLGVFKSVYVDYPPATNGVANTRRVRYTLEEGRRVDVRMILGWGSYDQLFGGAEMDYSNLGGVGDHVRLYGVQSFKSTVARGAYSIPEFLTPDLTAFLEADLLLRRELTFDRTETRVGTGLRKNFPHADQQVGIRYTYQLLRSEKTRNAATLSDLPVTAFVLDWSLDRRNNPLLPRRGFRAGVNLELAHPALGGEASYQRFEVHLSYHRPLARATWLHLGFWHGVAADFFFDRGPLPFNKRFFPGGETSLRGYRQGGASPVNARGDQLGAESAMVGNVELEQALTRYWSLVGFVDAAGITDDIDRYPCDQALLSAGGGIRWNTPVGPVRLEYGRNLNPRRHDPAGTLHFSLGYPF